MTESKKNVSRRRFIKYGVGAVVVAAAAAAGYEIYPATMPPGSTNVPVSSTSATVSSTTVPTSPSHVTLSILNVSSPEELAYTDPKILSAFEQSHPNITVIHDDLPQDAFIQLEGRELTEHTGRYDILRADTPTIFRARDLGAGYYLDDLGGHDPTFLAQLDPRIKPIVTDQKGRVGPAVPIVWNSMCLFCRKDLFTDPTEQAKFKAKYGYDLNYPDTWDQLRDAAEFFNRPPNLNGFWTSGAIGWAIFYGEFWTLLQSNGGEVMKNGAITVNTPEWAGALEFQKKMSAFSPEGWLGQDWFFGTKLLEGGKLAMQLQWYFPWPDFFDKTKVDPSVYQNVVALPVPKSPAGKRVAQAGGEYYFISKYSQHPNEAAELMRWWETFDVEKKIALGGSLFFPVRDDVVADPDVAAILHSDEFFKSSEHWSEQKGEILAPPEYLAYASAGLDPLAQAYNKYMTGEWSTDQALSWLQGQLETIVTSTT
jgi:ABC-type glycerol-3-phosphate transport system substrate-binding protein